MVTESGGSGSGPRVTLELERALLQGADLRARATFAVPSATPEATGQEWDARTPADAAFRVRQPDGAAFTYRRGHALVSTPRMGEAVLVVRATLPGRWVVRVEGTAAAGGQQVRVAAEREIVVLPSALG